VVLKLMSGRFRGRTAPIGELAIARDVAGADPHVMPSTASMTPWPRPHRFSRMWHLSCRAFFRAAAMAQACPDVSSYER
jgi:hypothetical protein